LVVMLGLPLVALLVTGSSNDLVAGMAHPMVGSAMTLSLSTTLISLAVVVLTGTPLAWRLAQSRGRWTQWLEPLVQLPVVLPPAVMGLALLLAFGRQGLLRPLWSIIGGCMAFTPTAVVLAQ